MPLVSSNGVMLTMETSNGNGTITTGIKSSSLLSYVSPVSTPSPRLDLNKTKKAVNTQRTIEEMRTHIAKLKSDLESERSKNKQLYRDKVAEVKQAKDTVEKDKEYVLQQLQVKLEQEKQTELQKLRESLHKDRDTQIRQLHRYKDDELKQLRTQFSFDKEDGIKVALEMQKKALSDVRDQSPSRPTSGSNSALIVKFQRENRQLKDSVKNLEEQLQQKTVSDSEKAAEIRRMHKEHQEELNRLVKEHKDDAQKDMEQLKKALELKQQELLEKEGQIRKLSLDRDSVESGRGTTDSVSSGATTPTSKQGSTQASSEDNEEVSLYTFLYLHIGIPLSQHIGRVD